MQGKLYSKLVLDVQLMINQLGNVTVLWEELWLSTLQDLHAGTFIMYIISHKNFFIILKIYKVRD